MSTVILSAAPGKHPALNALGSLLQVELVHAGEQAVRMFELGEARLAYCQGEFDCWVKTPGVCRAQDLEQDIVAAIHGADRLVLLDVVTFGGHSHVLKRAQDRLLCLLTPFFETRAALTHHASRYQSPAAFFALGWMPSRDAGQVRTWRDLADANALNMLAPRVGSTVVDDSDPAAWPEAVRAMLASTELPGSAIQARAPLRQELMEAAQPATEAVTRSRPTKAALLVGSAKKKGTSASENLARAAAARLEKEGVTAEIHFAMDFLRTGDRASETARAISESDLFLLFTPLYVDSFPALVTQALELLAVERAGSFARPRFVPVVNCGFPEPEQTRTAMRMARHFADRAGFQWAGGLPLGGGGAVNPARPLDEQHGPAEHIKRALDLLVPALARGDNVPPAALELMAQSAMPDVLYRVVGDLGWRYQAWQHGVAQAALKARPLDA